jgi:hypothetical protein
MRIARLLLAFAAMALLAGCGGRFPGLRTPEPAPVAGAVAPLPTGGASTAEEFDTSTVAERTAAAAAPAQAAETPLGTTVASLGNPAEPGFWLETPLVAATGPGRVVLASTGKSVQVELRPIDAAPGSGSRISLGALRLLGVALTDLPEIEVYAG